MMTLQEHLSHPFYRDSENYRHDIRNQQIEKGARKYPEPFTPSSWTNKQLADHAMQENVDQSHYIYGMKERMEEQAKRIAQLEANEKYYLSTIQAKDSYISKLEARQ